MRLVDHAATGRARVKVRPFRGRPDTAELLAAPIGSIVAPATVEEALVRARRSDFTRVVTPALPPYEWRPYLDAGFEVRERLHLLGHDLLDLPDRGDHGLRRARRRDLDAVLAVDHAAFEPFWRMDAASLDEAADATPSSRLRIARDRTGYALFGRAGPRGYVQRIAVRPDTEGRGLGTTLVVDGLWWLRRWRVTDALVNTQERNERAVALYERLGFRLRPGGLAVLEHTLAR